MKVLVIGAVFDPSWKGGEPILARNVVNGLRLLGNEVTVIYRKRKYSSIWPSSVDPRILNFYFSMIKKIKPDITLVFYDYDVTALYASKKAGIPCVVAVHIYWPFCPYLSLYLENKGICEGLSFKRCLMHISGKDILRKTISPFYTGLSYLKKKTCLRMLKTADAIIVPSEYVKSVFLKYKFNNVYVVYTGININEIQYHKKWSKTEECKVILNTTGYTTKSKGFHHFVILARYITKLRKNVRFVATGFCGRVDAVEGLGYLSRREYIKLVSRAYLAVTPLLWADPCPQAVLLPMAVGTPVIAYSSGGVPEILKDGGILIRRGDIRNLIRCTLRLIDDEQLTSELGKKARHIIENNFTIDHTIRGYYEVLKKALNRCL